MLLIITSTGDELLRHVNIDDLEPPKWRVFSKFFAISTATHISRVNCAKMAGDRPIQPACEIFTIECRFLAV